jgi:hypothetical protein
MCSDPAVWIGVDCRRKDPERVQSPPARPLGGARLSGALPPRGDAMGAHRGCCVGGQGGPPEGREGSVVPGQCY